MFENSTNEGTSARRPIVLTRGRAAFFVVFGYALAFGIVRGTLLLLKYIQASKDSRADDMTVVAGAVLAFLCIRALIGIYRRPRFEIEPSMLRDVDA